MPTGNKGEKGERNKDNRNIKMHVSFDPVAIEKFICLPENLLFFTFYLLCKI